MCYNEYMSWVELYNIEHTGFKGFIANIFGRIVEIAKEVLCRQQSIIKMFYAIVDVNSNKLVLAVSTYIQNNWFLCCAKIYSRLGDILIFPLMEILGIDSRGSRVGKSERNWAGVRSFFERKVPELKQIRDDAMVANDGQSRLYGALIDEVVDTLERQLSEMAYLQSYETRATVVDEAKMKFDPVTNLGCEAEFAKLDVRIVASGRSTSVQTYSRK